MKAIILRGSGAPQQVLELNDVPEPESPAQDEVIVRLTRRVIHAADYQTIRGNLPADVFAPDGILGIDGFGFVEMVGGNDSDDAGVEVGTRVILLPTKKTWTERVLVRLSHIQIVPDDISDDVACQIATNGVTAIMLAQAAEQAAGDESQVPVLITAAASSVASIMIAHFALRGRKVIGLIRREENAAPLAKRFDNLTVIGMDRSDWQEAVKTAAGGPVRVALDPIGGEMMPQFLNCLADGGTLIVYGGLDPRLSQISSGMLTGRELTIRGLSASNWPGRTSKEQQAWDFDGLFAMARQTPGIFDGYSTFPFADAAKAVKSAEQSPRRGATILASDG